MQLCPNCKSDNIEKTSSTALGEGTLSEEEVSIIAEENMDKLERHITENNLIISPLVIKRA